jgi:hypothetical protein
MRPAARRLNALILTAVLLIGGSGASALDVALYHLGGHVELAASQRVAGSEAPRPHGDACALVDWAARGPYTAAPPTDPVLLSERGVSERAAAPPAAPRPADLTSAPRPRAPPVQLS